MAGAATAVCVASLALGGSAVLAGGTGPSFSAQTVSLVLANTNKLVPNGIAAVTLAGHHYVAVAAAGRTSTNGVLNGTLAVYEGSTQYSLLGENCCDPTGLAAADINGDGSPDFALASAGSGSTPPSFAVENVTPDPAGASFSGGGASIANQGDGAGTPFVADLNGDSANDLVVPVPGRNELVLLPGFAVSPGSNFINTGGARFLSVGSSPRAAGAADLNGDGHQDLIVAEHGVGDVGLLLGNGNLTYQAETSVAACTGPQDVAVADLNGDGKQDVAVACDSGSVAILLGNGDGTLQPAVSYATGAGTRALRIADLNNDGHLDIAAVSSGDDNLWTLFNPGDGTFPDVFSTSLGAGAQPWALDVADLNGDGIDDVVVADHGTVAFTMLTQTGLPNVTFTAPQYLVNSTADAADANPGDGICAAAGGSCTLRAAVEETNATCGSLPIVVPAGTYQLTAGALVLSCDTAINGAGARSTVITRAAAAAPSRVLEIARGTITISGVSITNGLANGSDVEDNPGVGGGIWIDDGGHVTVSDSTISGNHASTSGGGIDNDGVLTVLRSTISGNSASGGSLQIGGGIDHFGSGLSITNSTISGNSAGSGGGVFSGSDATFVNDTIAGNTGGGFFRSGLANSQGFANTIVVDNTGGDCNSTPLTSDDHDLSPDGTCAFAGNGDPHLGALANNGGPTDTQAPGAAGAAIDTGDDGVCPATDQRGDTRPAGAHCDIGAVELTASAPPGVSSTRSTVQASPSSAQADGSSTSTITVTLRDTNGAAVAGKTVALSAQSGSSRITPAQGTTDGTGVAAFRVADGNAETVTYSAADIDDGVTVAQTASVTFTAVASSPPSGGTPPPSSSPPSVSFESAPPSVRAGEILTFSATATTKNGAITAYAWSFGDGSSASGPTVTHSFAVSGTFTVSVRVTDGAGLSASSSRTVVVAPAAPVTLAILVKPTRPVADRPVHFDAVIGSSASLGAAVVTWSFGDGGTASGGSVSHVYLERGSYTVAVTVTASGVHLAARDVVVVEGGPSPTIMFWPTQPAAHVTERFTGAATLRIGPTASTRIESWAWSFGDGGTSKVESPTHVYAAPGHYVVRLRVVDAGGVDGVASAALDVGPAGVGVSISSGVSLGEIATPPLRVSIVSVVGLVDVPKPPLRVSIVSAVSGQVTPRPPLKVSISTAVGAVVAARPPLPVGVSSSVAITGQVTHSTPRRKSR